MGRPVKVSPELIIQEALLLLDEVGIGFSVRTLAKRLGTGHATIYNHFANRNVLLEVMASTALNDIWPKPSDIDDWDKSLADWAIAFRKRLLKHPSLMGLLDKALFSDASLGNIRQLAHVIEKSGIEFADAIRQSQGIILVRHWFSDVTAS